MGRPSWYTHYLKRQETLSLKPSFALFCLFFPFSAGAADRPLDTWRQYLGGADSSQYSSLKQINKTNVKQLEVAWTYPAGPGTLLFDPIVVDGVMYVLVNRNSIVALDAGTGN